MTAAAQSLYDLFDGSARVFRWLTAHQSASNSSDVSRIFSHQGYESATVDEVVWGVCRKRP